ncbi:uncharacterized protein LOC143933581 [Lithobates pipiens]
MSLKRHSRANTLDQILLCISLEIQRILLMASLYQILGVFLALVTSSYSLSCRTCTSLTTSCYSGSSVTCPSGSVCLATYTKTKMTGGYNGHSYVLSCSPRDKCNMRGSVSMSSGWTIQRATSCCSTDNCTPPSPSLPSQNSASNRVTCRSCFAFDYSSCYDLSPMNCRGDENICIHMTTKLSGFTAPPSTFRGCATKGFCDLGLRSETDELLHCAASSGLQKGFYLPAVICLFLLKLWI